MERDREGNRGVGIVGSGLGVLEMAGEFATNFSIQHSKVKANSVSKQVPESAIFLFSVKGAVCLQSK